MCGSTPLVNYHDMRLIVVDDDHQSALTFFDVLASLVNYYLNYESVLRCLRFFG